MNINSNALTRMMAAIMNMIVCMADMAGTDEKTILKVLTEVNDFRLAKKEQENTIN